MAQFRQSGTDRLFARSQIDGTTVGDRIGIRSIQKFGRNRRVKPPHKLSAASVAIGLTLLAAFYLSFVAFRRLSGFKETKSRFDEYRANNKSDPRRRLERSLAFKELRFGHFSYGSGRDSRYWDRDDRRRDNDYSENEAISRISRSDSARKELPKERMFESGRSEIGRGGLYNEGGRKELDSYRRKYEDSLKNDGQARGDDKVELANTFDEYDDGVDEEVEHEDLVEKEGENGNQFDDGELVSADDSDEIRKWSDAGAIKKGLLTNSNVKASIKVSSKISGQSQMVGADAVGSAGKESSSDFGKKAGLKRKSKRQKASRPFCEMRFLDSTALLVEPLENKKFARFSLQYTEIEEKPGGMAYWVPRFAGRQSSQEREQSYYAHDQKINCGFINGPPGSRNTGFDLAEDDTKYMSSCHIAVSSCIFGNSDHLRTPFLKKISRQSRKNVCFIMFVDEITLQTLLSEGQKMDSAGFMGLWKIVVVQNLPYSDMRRVGKIPKLLTHRLFPSARYSIWLDSKLRLQSDPYLILEYFLWRKGYEYAISNHYDRHCVWEEVAQNKRLNKYNHTVIDEQFAFYQSDGLTRFDPSDPNKLLPSYVPEGSFIVRAHTPMSNLFSCLWFNEVDHWTPRDQLSFAYTYLKLRRKNPEKHFHLNMFKDCERRSIAKLFHHRDEDSRIIPAL